jgi:D-alanyl-D-alanine carboxypeptidase (penicillin-binding protein 5/6)
MIAVVMGAPDYKIRFSEAQKLLEYGYSITKVYVDENNDKLDDILVLKGKQEYLAVEAEDTFRYLDVNGLDFNLIEKEILYNGEITAPVEQGERVGDIIYSVSQVEIGRIGIIASEAVEKAQYGDYLKKIFDRYLI